MGSVGSSYCSRIFLMSSESEEPITSVASISSPSQDCKKRNVKDKRMEMMLRCIEMGIGLTVYTYEKNRITAIFHKKQVPGCYHPGTCAIFIHLPEIFFFLVK